jgi:anti-anti-sigma regulatory factor
MSDSINIAGLAGDPDGQGAAALREAITGELTGSLDLLVINLSDVAEIDVYGLDALHSAAWIAAEVAVECCLVAMPNGRVQTQVGCIAAAQFFETFPSVIEALRHSR